MNCPVFRLKLFGSASVTLEDGALIRGRPIQRHRIGLLALLVLAPTRSLSRDKLMGYLWPERDTEHARQLLNQAVHTLRKALGDEVVVSAGEELRLDPGVLKVDVLAFEEALASGETERAVGLYAGPFLDGFFLSDAPDFERWAARERDRLRRTYCQLLEMLAEEATAQRDHCRAVEWWRRLAAEEPYNGRITVRLMEALDVAGDRAGALQQGRLHTMLLQEEFAADPDPQVSALADRLRTESSGAGEGNEVVPKNQSAERRSAEVPPGLPAASAVPAEIAQKEPRDVPLATQHAEGTKRPNWSIARRSTITLGLLGIAALAVLLITWRSQGEVLRTNSQRVVVAPLENRTGDPSLDPLGRMAADRVSQALSRIEDVEVVTSPPVLGRSLGVLTAAAETAYLDATRGLAGRGARLLVSGAYYRQGDSVQFHMQITDTRERRLLRSLEPIMGAPADARSAVEELSRRTAAAVAVVLDTRLAALGNLASQPANYEAYHACLEGLAPFFAADWPAALRHFERSMRLDSTYLFPLLHIGYVRFNMGDLAGADSIVRVLNGSRERMMAFELAILDLLSGYVAEDPIGSYEAARRAAAIGPGSPPNVQWGAEALRLARPREAIRILSAVDPGAAPVGGWPLYWRTLTSAHHALGNHRQELTEARRARALYPHEAWPLLIEARALAVLGRLSELEALLRSRRSVPPHRSPSPGAMMAEIGHELRVHGEERTSIEWLERAAEWYRTQPPGPLPEADHRRELAFTLLAAGQLTEAEAILRDLATAHPQEVSVTGALGVLAARRGDAAQAGKIASELASLWRHYRNGEQLLWRACIAAHRDQLEAAVSLLQEAAGRAAHFEHTHFCLDPLRDYAAFHEFTRPKG